MYNQYIILLLYLRLFRLDLMLNDEPRPKALLQNHRPFTLKVELKPKQIPRVPQGRVSMIPMHHDSAKHARDVPPPTQ